MRRDAVLPTVLDLLVVAAAVLVLLTLTIDRIDLDLSWFRVRVSGPWRPLAMLVAALAARWGASRTSAGDRTRRWVLTELPTHLFVAIGMAWLVTAMYFGVRACGGLDSYGYVGAARLFASGAVHEPQPLAAMLPFPERATAAAPLGFVVGADGRSRVPRFPPGLPLVMAAVLPFGENAPFWIPLLLAVGTLGFVFVIGRHAGDIHTACFAAAATALSPTFFNAAIQPMSDVPATFWVVGAAVCALGPWRRPTVAGAMAGMAVLTRPALLPAALALVPLAFWRLQADVPSAGSTRGDAARQAARMALTIALFIGAHALYNQVLYGRAVTSGYGSTAVLLSPSRIPVNVWAYVRWITHSHTPLVWLAWAAGLAALRDRRWASLASLLAVAVAAPYLLYFTWDDWESTRFILPGLALVLTVSAVGVDRALAGRARSARPLLLVAMCLMAGTLSYGFLEKYSVFTLWRAEAKYPLVGDWVRSHTPADAVVISALHSGSLRYYAKRETVRWDEIPAPALVPTVQQLIARGRRVYLALDVPSEDAPFKARFGGELSQLVLIPVARVADAHIYELRTR